MQARKRPAPRAELRNVLWSSSPRTVLHVLARACFLCALLSAFSDNPVGTGFSYTEQDSGFVTNQAEVGQDLLSFMFQFYELYPQFQKVPLYITGSVAICSERATERERQQRMQRGHRPETEIRRSARRTRVATDSEGNTPSARWQDAGPGR